MRSECETLTEPAVSGKAFVIVSGFNDRAVLAACRALTRASLPFAVVSRGEGDPIELTRYRDRICARISWKLELGELTGALRCVRERLGVDRLVLLPSSEYLNRFALEHREILQGELNCDLPLPASDVYLRVSDKQSFSALCREYGIESPAEIQNPDNASLPFVAKPRSEVTPDGRSMKPVLLFNADDYAEFRSSPDRQHYYLQSYVGGKSYYLLFNFLRDGGYRLLVQRNGAQQPGGRSMLFAWPAQFPAAKLVGRYVEMFSKLGFVGLVMVEVKEQAGRYFMIEANPRLWGPLQMVVDVDPTFFEAYLCDALGRQIPHSLPRTRPRSYLWTGGIVETIRAGERIAWLEGGRRRLIGELLLARLRDVYLRSDSIQAFLRSVGLGRRSRVDGVGAGRLEPRGQL